MHGAEQRQLFGPQGHLLEYAFPFELVPGWLGPICCCQRGATSQAQLLREAEACPYHALGWAAHPRARERWACTQACPGSHAHFPLHRHPSHTQLGVHLELQEKGPVQRGRERPGSQSRNNLPPVAKSPSAACLGFAAFSTTASRIWCPAHGPAQPSPAPERHSWLPAQPPEGPCPGSRLGLPCRRHVRYGKGRYYYD